MKSHHLLAGPLFVALALVACSDHEPTTPNDPLVVRQLPEPVRAEAAEVVAGNTAFALDLYRGVSGQPGNLFLSPFSISTAFAMTYGGARGATESEMSAVLHFPFEQARLHPVFHELLKSLDTGIGLDGYRLDVANRLWGRADYAFLPEYLTLTREQYAAELATVDFAGQPEAARAQINAVEEDAAEDPPAAAVQPSSALVLTNAIYFKGSGGQFDRSLHDGVPRGRQAHRHRARCT
jgi:serpin B